MSNTQPTFAWTLPGQTDERLGLLVALSLHVVVIGAILLFKSTSPAPVIQLMTVRMLPVVAPAAPAKPKPPEPKPVVPKQPVIKPTIQRVKSVEAAPVPVEVPKPVPVKADPKPEPPRPVDPPAEVVPPTDAAYLNNPKPKYPPMSRKLHEEGTVRLKVHVDAAGKVLSVDIQKSSGFDRLDQSARQTVLEDWSFVPAKQGSQAVSAWATVPINFNLDGK